jgi:hypothetical protein
MEKNNGTTEVTFTEDIPRTRVRLIDWHDVMRQLDESSVTNPGAWGRVGEFDQSVRTHIRAGRYKHIDPKKYEVTTKKIEGKSRSRADLYMRKRAS